MWFQKICFEIALWHGYFPVNLLHIFRTPVTKNTLGGCLWRETPVQIFSCKFSKSSWKYFFKYTSGRLFRKEHWISLKWFQYVSLLMFLTLVIKRSLYFFLLSDCFWLISGNFHKNFIKVFLVLRFFLPSELKRMYRDSFFEQTFFLFIW